MKITKADALPGEIGALTSDLTAARSEISKINADIDRAKVAVSEAGRLDSDLDTLTRRRAEERARAFLAGAPPDLAELNRQLEVLEKSGRTIREDGMAAELAITMLETQRDDMEATLAATIEKRKKAVSDWLICRRDAAIQRYTEAIMGLERHVAEAAACDRVRRQMQPGHEPGGKEGYFGSVLLNQARACDYGFPRGLYVGDWPPVPWLSSHFVTGKEQDQVLVDEIVKLLVGAGVAIDPGSVRPEEPVSNSCRFAALEKAAYAR